MRHSNTTRTGRSFSVATVQAVWNKGRTAAGYDPNSVRLDVCGTLMSRNQYGNTASPHGWEIDHIQPVALGGPDAIWNFQPLQWQNNRHKSDNYPNWNCAV